MILPSLEGGSVEAGESVLFVLVINDPLQSPVRYTAGSSLAYDTPCMQAYRVGRQPLGEAHFIAPPLEAKCPTG